MLKRILSFTMIFMLTGCALLKQEEYSKKNIESIESSEQRLTDKIAVLDTHLIKQADNFGSLESKIINLNNEVESLKKQQVRFMAAQKRAAEKANPTSSTSTPASAAASVVEPEPRTGMITLGSLERVYIDIVESSFIARVDTGATTSSINAVDMQKFERNGKKWVKFHVSDVETAMEDRKWVEAPIIRHVKIRQSSTDDLERRPVVELWVKLGSIHEKTQFTLTDRTQMDYPILLGREFIQDMAFVDVSRDYIASQPRKEAKK